MSPKLELTIEDRAPLSIAVARRLREAIMSGDLLVGEELPSEKDLGRQLGVGRSTIREALRILQAQGLLSGGDTVSTSRPRVSSEQTLASAAATLESALRLGQVPLADLVELRVVIEGAIVEAAAAAEAPDLSVAESAVQLMLSPHPIDIFRAADLRFHQALATASGNAAYGLVMGVLRGAISAHLGVALHGVAHPKAAMLALGAEHAAILDAVSRGHGKRARELVAAHVRDFYAVAESRAAREARR